MLFVPRWYHEIWVYLEEECVVGVILDWLVVLDNCLILNDAKILYYLLLYYCFFYVVVDVLDDSINILE